MQSAVYQKVPLLFFNNSLKHWSILIIFGTWHQKKNLTLIAVVLPFYFNTVATLPCEMQQS